ncbi:universal stress protein [Rhodococcus opacus]|nr:universal stress protein [Rhodococcus opacus]
MMKKKHPARDEVRDWRKPVRVDGPAAATEPACHLVVGFDRYPASHAALSFAIGLAVPLHAYLHVAHIVDLDDFRSNRTETTGNGASSIPSSGNAPRRAPCSPRCGELELLLPEGNPAQLLATVADANDALMIIIGTSRGGLVSLLERWWGSRCPRT